MEPESTGRRMHLRWRAIIHKGFTCLIFAITPDLQDTEFTMRNVRMFRKVCSISLNQICQCS